MTAHHALRSAIFGIVLGGLALGMIGGLNDARGVAALAAASSPVYDASFSEFGLPAGTNWSVHVAYIGCSCTGVRTTVQSNESTLQVALPNGTYRYTVDRVGGYAVNGTASGTISVAGGPPSPIAIEFDRVVDYTVEFTETGLPSGTSWTVHVSGNGRGQWQALEEVTMTAASASMNFSLPNATYLYVVEPVNGSFFNRSAHGTFVVDGASPSPLVVRFITPPTFTTAFVESGLLSGMAWSVALHGFSGAPISREGTSTGTTVRFYLPNGTYYYRVAEVLGYVLREPVVGSFVVVGNPLPIDLTFARLGSNSLYLVDFNETGLAPGTTWSARVTAALSFGPGSREGATSFGATLSFALQNGSYRYVVLPVRGYTLSHSTGTVSVVGTAPAAVLVAFTPIPTYAVSFNETGLPSGTKWTVLVRTQTDAWSAWPVHTVGSSNLATITFEIPNGTYCYAFYPVYGWQITTGSATGSFVVADAAPPTIAVAFSR